MVVSFVLRLLADELERGLVAGELHVVASDERILVKDAAELLEALKGHRPVPPEAG